MGKLILKPGTPEYEEYKKDPAAFVAKLKAAKQPEAPSIPEEPQREPQSMGETALHSFGQGASFGFTDEGRGLMAGAGELGQMMREGVGLEEKTSQRGMIERLVRAYEEERNRARGDIKKGEADNPKTALVSEIAGAVMAPGPKAKALPAGSTRLARMAQYGKNAAPVGAASGAGKSEAEDLPGLVKDTAVGGALSAGTGAALGGALHGPLSRLEGKEQAAIEKGQKMAREFYDAPQLSAQGTLGGKVQSGHRDLEVAREAVGDPLADPAITKALQAIAASPEGIALRNRVLKSKAEGLPGKLGEIDNAQAVFDAAKAANTPDAVAAKAQEILGAGDAAKSTGRALSKYLGRAAPIAIGTGIGAIGGPEWAGVGGLVGTGLTAVMGKPGTAISNLVGRPSVAMRLAQLGQSPAVNQMPQKALATLTSDEEQRRRYLELLSKGR